MAFVRNRKEIVEEEKLEKVLNEPTREKQEIEKARLYDKKYSYLQAQTSMSHTLGNCLAAVQNWIYKKFPEGTFNTVHVSTKLGHRQLRTFRSDIAKKNKPMFVIRPRVDWNDNEKFLAGTPLIEHNSEMQFLYGGGNLQEFITIPEINLKVDYQVNRTVMYFDVVFVYSTYIQQMNAANMIRNQFRINRTPFFITTYLESMIPKDILEVISKKSGIPIVDENGRIDTFLSYIQSHSIYPISYKLQGSSGTHEFFRYYPVNIDCVIDNFDVDEGTQNGMVNSDFKISFQMRSEFYTTGFYFAFGEDLPNLTLNDTTDPSRLVSLFTDVFDIKDLNLNEGWVLYNSPVCKLEDSSDVIDLDQCLSQSLINVIKICIQNNWNIHEFIDIRIREQGKLIYPGEKYKIDWNKREIHFKNCNTYFTYKILIAYNQKGINETIKNMIEN